MIASLVPLLADDDRNRDPLKHYRCAGNHVEWVYRNIHRATRIYCHGANKSSKTTMLAALLVAICRGVRELYAFDGTPIPIPVPDYQRGWPIRVGLGTPSYKLGEASIMAAIFALIGDHPHHIGRTAAGTDVIYIRHARDMSDDWHTWSQLLVIPYVTGREPEALRLDMWGADEPPPEAWLDAIFNRGKAGRELYGVIAATPIDEEGWAPIRKIFPTEDRVVDSERRASIRASVYDNRFLHVPGCPGRDSGVGYCGCSCPDIVQAEQANASSAYADARLHGIHVNVVGQCPFDSELLDRWEAKCRDPLHEKTYVVETTREIGGHVRPTEVAFPMQVWAEFKPGHEYALLADPGSGKDDDRHDPDGIHVRDRTTRELVARVNANLGPWGLAAGCAAIGAEYGFAHVYVGRGGGWGDSVVRDLEIAFKYPLQGVDVDVAQRSTKIGFGETTGTRVMAMNAVGSMLQRGDTDIPSREVIRCLRKCRIDATGKIAAAYGGHDEDLILLGHGERILDMLGPPPERIQAELPHAIRLRDAVRREFGQPVRTHESDGGQPVDTEGSWQ